MTREKGIGQARSDIGARRRPQSVEGEAAISVGGSSANTAACASRRIISALTSLTRYVLPSIRRARLSDTNSTIPVVAANRHHLRQNTRHEHDYPCSRTTTGETLHTLSHRAFRRAAKHNSSPRFFFSPARNKPPRNSLPPPDLKYRPFFNHTFRPRLVLHSSAFSPDGYQLLSSRTTRAELLGPRQTSICPFETSAILSRTERKGEKERDRERLGPVKSVEESSRSAPITGRLFRFNDSFLCLPFTNLEHQLIPEKPG